MKHLSSVVACLFMALFAAQTQTPDFKILGFATLDGGTTGGSDGQVVTPNTFAELKQFVENKTVPYIIRIEKEFNTGVETYVDGDGSIVSSDAPGAILTSFGSVLRVGSNKTIIGIGDKAFFNRIGLVIQCQSNIIIRNIRFTMKSVPATRDGEYKILDTDGISTIGDPDCIGIQADAESVPEDQRISQHIWIDHCEFYNEDVSNKDRYDGLIDNKNNVQNITISWCYFHNHSKALLSGKGSSDDFNRTITYHHNYFYQIYGSRLPLLRFGQHHYFNNYMNDCKGDGVNLRINTNCYIENNFFKDSKKPVFGKISENGQAKMVNNIFENCSRLHQGITNMDGAKSEPLSSSEEFLDSCNFIPSDLYMYVEQLDETLDVPLIVKTYSGVGIIAENNTSNPEIQKKDYVIWSDNTGIFIKAGEGEIVSIYSIHGRLILTSKLRGEENFIPIKEKGIVVVSIRHKTGEFNQKIVLQKK